MKLISSWWVAISRLLSHLRIRSRSVLAAWRARYNSWVERERAKNDNLRRDGDEKWQEVKQLWRKSKRGQ